MPDYIAPRRLYPRRFTKEAASAADRASGPMLNPVEQSLGRRVCSWESLDSRVKLSWAKLSESVR